MSDMDEWRTHPCTVQFRKDIEDAHAILGNQLAMGTAMRGNETALEYAKLVGWAEGFREVIQNLRGDE